MLKPGELNQLFIQTQHLHYRKAHNRFSAFGLGEGQPRLLRKLAEADGMSQADLARRCNLEPATITVGLGRLEKAGLVERKPDENDLRVMRIWLTTEGRELNSRLHQVFLRGEEENFEGFSLEEREQLADFLRRMQENLLRAVEVKCKHGESD